jgi:hypothetical protein
MQNGGHLFDHLSFVKFMDSGLPDDLVLLEVAVHCIYSAAYDDLPTTERLTGLAQAVIALCPVYTRGCQGDVAPVAENDLRDALVRDCGAALHFTDGRAPLHGLFITKEAIDRAIELLGHPVPNTPSPLQGHPLTRGL